MVAKTLPRITIRAIREEDIEGVFAVDGKVGGRTNALTFSGPISDYFGKGTGIACVARAGEDVVGLIMGRLIRPFPGCQYGAWIEAIGVASEYRRSGIATKLIRAFEEQCRKKGVTCIHILTANDDKMLKPFLEATGFEISRLQKWDKQIT